MGRYPKFKRVKLDLLKSTTLRPVGAFVQDGKITTGWRGVSERVSAIEGLSVVCASKVGKGILAGTKKGKIYLSGTSGAQLEPMYSDGGSSPFAFETQDSVARAVLISGNTYTVLDGGKLHHAEMPVNLICGTMRKGRLFAADGDNPYVLRWSGAKWFADWTEGISGAGSLTLEPFCGPILQVFDFEDELVVLRERGIMRFSVFGNPENFKEIKTVLTPEIYPDTAAISGDGIIFLSTGGLMRYSGGRIAKIDGLISDDILSPTSACVYDGRFYFICGTSKKLAKSVVYAYDLFRGVCEIINTPAYFVACDGASLLAYASSTVYRLEWGYEYTPYEVATERLNFGTDKRVLVTGLEVDCDSDVRVSIFYDRGTKTVFCANGKTRLNIRGSDFKVTFSGYGGSVRSAYLTAEVIE